MANKYQPNGGPATLTDLVITALEHYLEDQTDLRAHAAALAAGGAPIPLSQVLAEFGADVPAPH